MITIEQLNERLCGQGYQIKNEGNVFQVTNEEGEALRSPVLGLEDAVFVIRQMCPEIDLSPSEDEFEVGEVWLNRFFHWLDTVNLEKAMAVYGTNNRELYGNVCNTIKKNPIGWWMTLAEPNRKRLIEQLETTW